MEVIIIISIDHRSAKPICYQVRDEFKKLILTKAVRNGEKLPSVRELASSLAINPNTIQRAYRELENEGMISSAPGRGVFAVWNEGHAQRQIETHFSELTEIIRELATLDMTGEKILARLSEIIEREVKMHD